jgi:hypothetical protein
VSRRRTGALADYCGAVGRLDIERVIRLSPRDWAIQPKVDGAYAHVYLDSAGRIERILSRTGLAFPTSITSGLLGCEVGAPDSVLAGELECHTEQGNAAAEARGYRVIHLFDAIRVGGQYLAREPHRVRRDWLYRSQSWAENMGKRRHYRYEARHPETKKGAKPGNQNASKNESPEPGLSFPPAFIDDTAKHARDISSGRFCTAVPRTWERAPIVPLLAPAQAGELWERAVAGDGEGVVAVALDAPLGKRGSKRKCKPSSTIDAIVLTSDRTGLVVRIRGASTILVVGHRAGVEAAVGDTVECEHEGWHGTGVPRFARLVRRRPDLMEGVAV